MPSTTNTSSTYRFFNTSINPVFVRSLPSTTCLNSSSCSGGNARLAFPDVAASVLARECVGGARDDCGFVEYACRVVRADVPGAARDPLAAACSTALGFGQ